MLRSIKKLIGYNIKAKDDHIGLSSDFYFDDSHWIVRYLVVDPGSLGLNRKVLLSPAVIETDDWKTSTLSVMLTKMQVENSPNIDLAKPISRQQETELSNYFKWPVYWAVKGIAGEETADKLLDPTPGNSHSSTEDEAYDPHLRSVEAVTGYNIEATDGDIGQLEDFVIDMDTWKINYMVINTGSWLSQQKVIIAPSWVTQVASAASKVFVDLTRTQVENSPEYDPTVPINTVYEKQLYDYYGRPHPVK